VYHLELRKFPHTACRFNQSEAQVRAILVAWVNEQWFEEGEQKWNSNEATLTVLEGPKLSMPELAMGRGWRSAQRRSQDVTERVLAAIRQQVQPAAAGAGPTVVGGTRAAAPASVSAAEGEGRPAEGAAARAPAPIASAESQLLADSLALELLALLDERPVALARAWNLAAERLGDPSAAESLALAEQAVRSLLGRALVVLCEPAATGEAGEPEGGSGAGPTVAEERVEASLRAVDSWSGGERGALQIARRT
jgi:hypothetical protein